MKITVKENRELIMINARNTQNENDVETLQITVPEKYEDFNKEIVFVTNNGVVFDIIENDTYTLKRNITKFDRVNFYIRLTKDEQDFRSMEKTLYFNKNHQIDGEVTPEEQTQMEQVISILEGEINKVENIDIDVNKEGKTSTVTITNKQGNEKSVNIIDGQDGENGFSPTIRTIETTDGYDLEITDVNGTNTITIENGQDGATGATGNGISSITKTSTSGLVDTYTIQYTTGNTTTYTVTNGAKRRYRSKWTKSDKMATLQ